MKNKKIYNNFDDMMKISKNLDNNRLEKILNNILNINEIKSTRATKKEYETIYKQGQPTNYNKIILTRYKKIKNTNYIIKYYFIEYETFAKDYYKIKKIELIRA